MNPKPSKRQRFKNFILRRKLNTLGLLVITLMSGLITIACAVRGFSHTDILILVTALIGSVFKVGRFGMAVEILKKGAHFAFEGLGFAQKIHGIHAFCFGMGK